MTSSLRKPKQYELEKSPFFQLKSKKKLAELLNVSLPSLSRTQIEKLASCYRIFVDRESRRFITEPVGELQVIHQRLLQYFSRIAPPDYLHSARKKRSYKSNAEQHIGNTNVLKIDIKKFFPSVQFSYIHDFFSNQLQCAPDIAAILARLCTVKTSRHGVHLPTGSCISPVLSFLANKPMFDRVAALCASQRCTFSLYVDDITISGAGATHALLTSIAVEINNAGYGFHKIKSYFSEPAVVTGLIVTHDRLCLPHERQKKIREVAEALRISIDTGIRERLLASLVGRLSEAEQIDTKYGNYRKIVLARYSADWKRVVAHRLARMKKSAKRP
ncbi:RNA-directed DNA polymerase [Duganella sp. FT3S]|uniref:RNA-directed DNA polymerase n=1 Tax=Rugamonas fusca TaxID=2758568 RepID=A0A7W2EM85_9BURK|nr:reverse transcriptase family protein [Rugamonas fusca]MBA5608512.1 RNA-directed DNA polymerase [Rugamonas fusca]